jgi:hypothetical protein
MPAKKSKPSVSGDDLINKQTRGVDAQTARQTGAAYPAAIEEMRRIQQMFIPAAPNAGPPANPKLLMRQQNQLQKFVNYVTPDTKDNPASKYYRKDRDPKYMHTYKSKP